MVLRGLLPASAKRLPLSPLPGQNMAMRYWLLKLRTRCFLPII